MNCAGNAETSGKNVKFVSNSSSGRRRRLALAVAAMGAMAPCGLAMGQATITTSNGAPVGAAIAQPDFSNSALVNWEDYTNNAPGQGYPYPSGPGQTFFVPANTSIDLQSVTIKGGGDAGGDLSHWAITVGSVSGTPGWGAGATILDTETASGAPIATDVANGLKSNYDQFTLANPQMLTGGAAGSYYFFAVTTLDSGNNGGYYGLAKSAGADPMTGVSTALMDLNPSGASSVEFPQSYDYTYYINGSLVTLQNNNATWANASGGNWSSSAGDSGNWVASAPPATSSSTATFDTDGGTISGTPTVTVVGGQEVSQVTFNNTSLGGGYTLTGSTVTVTNQLNSLAGNNSISSLNIVAGILSVSSGSVLTVASLSHTQYDGMNINGGGTLNIGTIPDPQGNIDVAGGTTVNITGSIPSGAFIYDVGVATATDTLNLGSNNVYDSNSISGAGTIVLGSGTTLTTGEYNGFTFSGALSGPGTLIMGSIGGVSSAGNPPPPYTGAFLGTSPNFSGPITVAFLDTLQVGAGASLGNNSATNTLTLDSGILQAAGNDSLPQNIITSDSYSLSGNNTTIDTQTFSLTLSGNISGGNSLTKIGTGTLTLGGNNTYAGPTIVSAGTLVVAAATALPSDSAVQVTSGGLMQLADNITAGTPYGTSNVVLGSLSLTGTGTLDIGNNRIIISYTPGNDPIGSIELWIKNGFADGDAVGGLPAIISSDIATDDSSSGYSYGIGYADSADPGNPAGLATNTIEIMLTLLGDANLDGVVNAEDFTPFSHNLNQNGVWDQGDFNYDGVVNAEDFTPFSHNLNQSATLAAAAGSLEVANGLGLANVPEPASMGLVLLAGVGALSRRSRRPKSA